MVTVESPLVARLLAAAFTAVTGAAHEMLAVPFLRMKQRKIEEISSACATGVYVEEGTQLLPNIGPDARGVLLAAQPLVVSSCRRSSDHERTAPLVTTQRCAITSTERCTVTVQAIFQGCQTLRGACRLLVCGVSRPQR